ncbi:MAG: type IV pilus assembly protein PilM [Nitrospinaceae bacterium]|nr:MAG: type IV pilus assembly protein PilM [Nitrospinaceae bacterium]
MFLSSKTPLVALDVGSHSIKLAQLNPLSSKNKYELTSFGIMPLPEDTIVDGVIKNHDEVVDAVTRLVKAEKVNTRYAVASVSGEAVIIKKIKVPQMSAEELQDSIAEEAEQYIPFDIDDVAIDFQILGPSRNGGDEESEDGDMMDILLVAVQREMIYNRTDVLIDAGLKPVIVDLDVFAMVNAVSLSHDLTEMGAVALIDLGESFTHVNIVLDGVTAYTRDIPVGGGYCSRRLMSTFDVTYSQVTELKAGKMPAGIDSDKVVEVITGSFDKVLDEIQKCFEFFSTTSSMEVEKVILTGGGAMIHGVDGFFSEHLKVPVEIIDPLKGIKVNSRNFDKATIAELAPLSTVALGLATRRFDYQ